MGRTEAFPRIHPKRPTANLVSKKVLSSLIGQIAITSGFQIITFFHVRAQSWLVVVPSRFGSPLTLCRRYIPPIIDPEELDIVSFENTALFLVSSFQYILVATIFCVGPPYRKPIYTNRSSCPDPLNASTDAGFAGWLVLAIGSLSIFSLYTLFTTTGPIFNLLELISLPREFHLELLILLLGNIFISYVFEEYGSEIVARFVGDTAKKWRRFRGRRREDGKVYKAIARDMED